MTPKSFVRSSSCQNLPGQEFEELHVVRVLVEVAPGRLAAERVLDQLGLVGGGEEQVQLGQQRLQEPIFLHRLALGDQPVRVAGQGVAVGDGHRAHVPAPADEVGQVAAAVGVAAIGEPGVHVVDDPGLETFHRRPEDVEIEVVVGVREVGDPAAVAAGGAVDEGRAGREARMDVRRGHVDPVGGHGVVPVAALGVEAVVIAVRRG